MEAAKVPSKKRPPAASKRTAKREAAPESVAIPAPSLRLYRRIAGAFVVLVAAVLAIVLFVSTTKATIRIIPSARAVETSFLVDVVPTGAVDGKVSGSSVSRQYEQAKEYSVSGDDKKEVFGKSGGTVTIVNETSRAQPLVATTRLLSSAGVLFRLDEGVTVPANGSVQAVVHADQEGPTGDIGPDRFTIPGLSVSQQAVIYATSEEPMTGGVRHVSVVTQEELDQAATSLESELLERAKSELRAEAPDGSGEAFTSKLVEKVSDTIPGTESDRFTISIKIEVTAVFYDSGVLAELTEAKLYEVLEKGFEFSEIAAEPVVTVQSVNVSAGTAQLRATRSASAVVSATHPVLDKGSLVGLSKQEVKDRLISAGLADDVQVEIFPPWVGTIPSLKDHIEVVIE
jgi:hypothetical protein